MLADALLGYMTYAPGTLVIKGLMGLCAALIFRALRGRTGTVAASIVGGLAAECIMVFGYFAYESTLLGYGIGAAASIPSNAVQGAVGLVLGVALYQALAHVPVVKRTIEAF